MAGKRHNVFTVVKFTTPQTGKIAHFSGCVGIGFRLMNVLEWGCKAWYTQGKSTAAQAAILYPLIQYKRLYGVLHGRKGLQIAFVISR